MLFLCALLVTLTGCVATEPRIPFGDSVSAVTANEGSTNSLLDIVVILFVLLICTTLAVSRVRNASESESDLQSELTCSW
jgi:hypothetical protein